MQNWKPFGALAALCILWGTTYFAIKIGVQSFPTFLFSGIRFVIAGGLIVLWYLFQKNVQWPSKRELIRLIISGSFIFIGGNLFLCLAELSVPSGVAALVNTAFPLWIVVITRLWNPIEKTPLMAILGILIGFAGQWMIFYEQLYQLDNALYLGGFILLILGVINGAFGSVYLKKYPVTINPVLTGGLQMLCCGTITTIVGVLGGEVPQLNTNPDGWWSMVYLIIAGSVLGYSFFLYALHHLPATMVSVYAYVNPIVALSLGWMFLSEPVSQRSIWAMAVTLTGVYFVNRGMMKARAEKLQLQKQDEK
ncbi:drug/metabolite exporter YedA [soil metagenome]